MPCPYNTAMPCPYNAYAAPTPLSGKLPESFSLRNEACFVMLLINFANAEFFYRTFFTALFYRTFFTALFLPHKGSKKYRTKKNAGRIFFSDVRNLII
jgi:hypothetical protein